MPIKAGNRSPERDSRRITTGFPNILKILHHHSLELLTSYKIKQENGL